MGFGWMTLDTGEQALIYDASGRARVEEGPQRLFLWRETEEILKRWSANQNEYLRIKYTNGKVEHKSGPCILYENPLIIEDVRREQCTSLDANEVLVVYNRDEVTNKVSRYLQHGPIMFMPKANEWLHSFCWHGTDPNNKTRQIPGAHSFTKLQVIPDQFYYNTEEVRTADDALMRVKLMIFYELRDIEKMLSATQDPIADLINCVCADVISFSSKLTYMEFIERSGELNDISKYHRLAERCKAIGYEVSKVVFRGYFAWDKLQKMHDDAIAKRTKLKIAYESEEQEQLFTDANLKAEKDRLTTEQSLELEQLRHKHQIERSQQEHDLKLAASEFEEQMKHEMDNEKAKLNAKRAKDEEMLKHLKELKDMQVDLTSYLAAQNPRPTKLIQVIAGDGTNLHLHQNTT